MPASPSHRPHILLTNDDGIEADGLRVLAEALAPIADLTIVAPRVEQSGMGHAITVFKDMPFEAFTVSGELQGWALSGTPVDCVKVAVADMDHPRPIDLVVSGINRGQNAGVNILYSGTVAAAREGALLGLPAIAVSLLYHKEEELPFEVAGQVGAEVVQWVLANGLPPGVLLNVNVPPVPYEAIKGWLATRMGNSGYVDHYVREQLEAGPDIRRNVGKGWQASDPYADDTDDHAIMNDYVSITPLQADLTAHDFMKAVHTWTSHHP